MKRLLITTVMLTGLIVPALSDDRTYVDIMGRPITDVMCLVPDSGKGMSDDTLACHSASKGGLQCVKISVLGPSAQYKCTRSLDDIDARKAVPRECPTKPTWLGVLFCRWDQ